MNRDQAPREKKPPNWDFAHTFRAPAQASASVERSWAGALALAAATRKLAAPLAMEVERLLVPWSIELSDLGGDPSSMDWSQFRPLRLSREEDWSDWLAHLLAADEAGAFSRELLGGLMAADAWLDRPPMVEREVRTAAGWRCDLVLEWANVGLDIEVKVGDANLDKTFDTAASIERERPKIRRHAILLTEDAVDDWRALVAASRDQPAPRIEPLTWRNVAKALRRCLRSREASLLWRAWAMTFCGAVEQTILGLPVLREGQVPPSARSARGVASLAIYRELLEPTP